MRPSVGVRNLLAAVILGIGAGCLIFLCGAMLLSDAEFVYQGF